MDNKEKNFFIKDERIVKAAKTIFAILFVVGFFALFILCFYNIGFITALVLFVIVGVIILFVLNALYFALIRIRVLEEKLSKTIDKVKDQDQKINE